MPRNKEMTSHTVPRTSISSPGSNETLDGAQSKFQHSNLTGTAKSEIKISVSRKHLGQKLYCLVQSHSTNVLRTSVQIGKWSQSEECGV